MPLKKSKGNISSQQKYAQSSKGKETRRNWRIKNKSKVNEWKREWAASENGKESARQWYKKSPLAMYALYKKSAIKRGLKFNISLNMFINMLRQPCVYCGSMPPQDSKRNGLDRIRNNQGYVEANIVPCCIACNQMKGKRSVNEFIKHINKIIKFQEKERDAS